MLFFIAGFETTASTLNYAMFELAWSPHVQEKVITFHSMIEYIINMVYHRHDLHVRIYMYLGSCGYFPITSSKVLLNRYFTALQRD
mgnify:CR=1 FL=1